MYDEKFENNTDEYPYQVINNKEEIQKILNNYIEKYYSEDDDKKTWFDKIKELSTELGYAGEVKEFKANPEKYSAHVGDVSTVLRVALTKRTNTPDMYEIMKALYDIGFDGIMRPDHGRAVWGEVSMPGYGLYDRAMGACYLNGLWEAICKQNR